VSLPHCRLEDLLEHREPAALSLDRFEQPTSTVMVIRRRRARWVVSGSGVV